MAETSIEWTDWSINPIRIPSTDGKKSGHYCVKCSPGCAHCYASELQPVFFGLPKFEHRVGKTEGLFLDPKVLEKVLRRRVPTKIFWCDMTDMFGDWVPFEFIAACFGVMAATPHHTHQILTKRPERMHAFFEWVASGDGHRHRVNEALRPYLSGAAFPTQKHGMVEDRPWPLPNVWLGTSTENQPMADQRIPWLLRCPAAVWFISAEPLLGPLDLKPYLEPACTMCGGSCSVPAEGGGKSCPRCFDNQGADPVHLSWVIPGGESGKKARPSDVAWIRSIVRQCQAAGVAVLVKQLGAKPFSHAPEQLLMNDKKGGDMSEWPEDLRVRQFPARAGQP